MSTFHERKLMRIIKALQEDLPNVLEYHKAPDDPYVTRLIEKRVHLQEAKGICTWKVGSDAINVIVQKEKEEG